MSNNETQQLVNNVGLRNKTQLTPILVFSLKLIVLGYTEYCDVLEKCCSIDNEYCNVLDKYCNVAYESYNVEEKCWSIDNECYNVLEKYCNIAYECCNVLDKCCNVGKNNCYIQSNDR